MTNIEHHQSFLPGANHPSPQHSYNGLHNTMPPERHTMMQCQVSLDLLPDLMLLPVAESWFHQALKPFGISEHTSRTAFSASHKLSAKSESTWLAKG